MSGENEAGSTQLSSSNQDAPQPDNATELERFMRYHKLHAYTPHLLAAGFEELEDLPAVCQDKALLDSIINLPGHQAKFLRVVNELGYTNSRFKKSPMHQLTSQSTNSIDDCERSDVGASPSPIRDGNDGAGPSAEGQSDDDRPAEHCTRIPQRQRLAVRHRSHVRDHSPLSRQGSNSRFENEEEALALHSPSATKLTSVTTSHGGSKRILLRKYVDFKIVVVGQGGVGKTALIHRLVSATFNSRIKCTIGVEFTSKMVQVTRIVIVKREGEADKEFEVITDVNLQFWDIAGQEDCGNATRTYYHGAKAALIVYDATNPSSLTTAIRWKRDLESKVKFSNSFLDIPVVLVANKVDALLHSLPLKRTSISDRNDRGSLPKSAGSVRSSAAPPSPPPQPTTPTDYSPSQFSTDTILTPPETSEEVLNLMNAFRFSGHFFASAKSGLRMDEICDFLVTCILKMDPHGTNVVPLSIQKNPEQSEATRAATASAGAKGPSPIRLIKNDPNSPQKSKKKKGFRCVV